MEPRAARPPSVGARARADRTAHRSSDLVRVRADEPGGKSAASGAQNAVRRCAWAPAADQMLEFVKIDAGSCYPLGQRREVTHPERLEKAPAEDQFDFF